MTNETSGLNARLNRILFLAAAAAALLAWGMGLATSGAAAGAACDKVASPLGSDAYPGTVAEPYATVDKLANSLSPGQTGCLRAGVYQGDVRVNKGGVSGAPTTITSYPGERATVVGRFRVADAANYVTVTQPRPRRAQRGEPAESDDQRRSRHVRRQRRHEPSHDDLLPARQRRLRPRARHRHRAQPHPQLRRAPGHQPSPRHLRGGLGPRPDHRQLDLRQRGPRGAAVPGRAGDLHRAQRDRRQRAGDHLLPRVRRTTSPRTT